MCAMAAIEAARHVPARATRDDAIRVVRDAIDAGIAGDTGSGGTVHLVVIDAAPDAAGKRPTVTRLSFPARRLSRRSSI